MGTLAGSAKLQRGLKGRPHTRHSKNRAVKKKADSGGGKEGPGEHQVQALCAAKTKMNQSLKEGALSCAAAPPYPTRTVKSTNMQAKLRSSPKQHPVSSTTPHCKFQPEVIHWQIL